MALTTRSAVKLAMGIPTGDTSKDDLIDARILSVDAMIKKWLGRDIERVVGRTEYLSGLNSPVVRLRETPVILTGLSVYLDPYGYAGQGVNAFADNTLLTRGSDYILRVDQTDGVTSMCGLLERIGTVWPGTVRRDRGMLTGYFAEGVGNIKVVYTGGYSSVPADIADAANKMVTRSMNVGKSGMIATSESFEDRSVSFGFGSSGNFLFTSDIVSALMPYRRISP
jgi:hypothetical protein